MDWPYFKAPRCLCGKGVKVSQCSYTFRDRTHCDQPALDGRVFCLFHDTEVWRPRADEIREGIMAKMRGGTTTSKATIS